MRHRLQLHHHSDFPDAGWGPGPDALALGAGLNSDMSALTEIPPRPGTDYEQDYDQEVLIIETRTPFVAAVSGWRPALNAYRCQEKFVVFVDLAGVPPESIDVQVQSSRLVIRGDRPAPEPACEQAEGAQLLALEIDHGAFERALNLPAEVNPDDTTMEYREGLLRIELRVKG
jgi:HSP20 family protein